MLGRAQREQRTRSQGRIVLSRRMLNARRYSWSSRFARVAARNDPAVRTKLRVAAHPRDLHPPVVPVCAFINIHVDISRPLLADRRAFQDKRVVGFGLYVEQEQLRVTFMNLGLA